MPEEKPARPETFKKAVPTYTGPHGDLLTSQRIPSCCFMAVRKAVCHACVATQAGFMHNMVWGYQFMMGEDVGHQREIWEQAAKVGACLAFFDAYNAKDHTTLASIYALNRHDLEAGVER